MTSKLLFPLLVFFIFVSCSDKDKKTIGTPSGFSPSGSEFNLTPNLSAAALRALVSAQNFPLSQEGLFFQNPAVREHLENLSEDRVINSLQRGTSGEYEWLKVEQNNLQLRLSVEGENTLMEVWQLNPFLYSRLFSSGTYTHTFSKSGEGIVNYVYRNECSQSVLKSLFEMGRKNSMIKTGEGEACEGLSFYRENEIPELVNQWQDLEGLNQNKEPLPPQLEIFYEVL